MCYMSESKSVGVRDLRQNLSVYLRRVMKGETLQVTERGKPVAVLSPTLENSSPLGRLFVLGRATRPIGELVELLPPPKWRGKQPLSEALEGVREDRF